jgi:hypothetical protein
LSATEWLVLLMPVPLTATDGAVLVALLTTVTVPLSVPVVFGANTICIVAVCPAASVAPLIPLVTLYADPLILTPEIVTLEFPVLIRATARVVLSPTVSLPKFSFDVDDTRLLVEPEPVPLRPMVTRAIPLLFFRVRLPAKLPDVVGLNPTAKYVVAPTLRENGVVKELILNADPLMETLETVTPDVLLFLIASVCVFLLPTATVPNETEDGVEVREAACALPAVTNKRASATRKNESETKCRWEGPPGRGLFKKAC